MRTLSLAALFCAALAGCTSKIKPFDEDLTIEPAGFIAREVDGPAKDQKVRIEVVGATEPVTVFVMLSKDFSEKLQDEQLINAAVPGWKKPNAVIDFKTKTKDGVLEVSIPAKELFKVLIENPSPKTAKLKLKINSL